jgi:hypothetical protein
MSAIDATPTYNFLVDFAFAHPVSSLRPESQRWGTGSIPINTDKLPETDEEKKEIAREIGKQGGFEIVAITKITPTDHFVDDSSEILEGLIIND